MMETFSGFIISYGYLAVFAWLMVGICGVPVPDEVLLFFIGYLVFQGEMHFWPATAVVIAGSCVGLAVNYLIGRACSDRLCTWLERVAPHRLQKLTRITAMLDRSGGVVLFWSFFVPGIRHWATVGAGVLKVSPTVGGIFVFPAIMLWSIAFIWLGYHVAQTGADGPQNLPLFLQGISAVVILAVVVRSLFFRRVQI
jgi:membrane protein DedA with SNARE-associated domain